MREIKFRAKSLDGGLVYFSLYEVTNYFPSDDVFYIGSLPCRVGSEQEYTGLKDKNGKEIYEGDILSINLADIGVENFIVKWVDGKARFHLVDKLGDTWGFDDSNDIEVIGNIYENPELLGS